MFDARLLLVAALVASPAAYRSAQGMLPVSEAMTRYLLVALGCVVVSTLVRALWPLVAGTPSPTPTTETSAAGLPGGPADTDGADGADGADGIAGVDGDSPGGFGGFGSFDDVETA